MSRCWWRGHKWLRWEDIVVRTEIGTDVSRQKRYCARCGISKWRRP